MFCFISTSFAIDPLLFFSDLISGPSDGWNSTTNKGVAVTVWGHNLGINRESNYVSVGGVDLVSDDDYAIWGELDNNATKIEKISFWLNSSMNNGDTTINITVNGITSNNLNFTIRNGNIYFITPTGRGNGSYENPFSPFEFVDKMKSTEGNEDGVTGYFRDGNYTGEYGCVGWRSNFCLGSVHSGVEGLENAFIGYPSENATIIAQGSTGAYQMGFRTHTIPSDNIIISNLNLNSKLGSIQGRTSWRIVGNYIDAIDIQGSTGSITTLGDNISIYGNTITGGESGNKLDHAIYLAEGKNTDVAWNYIYGNNFDAGPMISINHDTAGVNNWTFENYHIHHNVIDTSKYPSRAAGMYETGNGSDMSFYNNIVIGPTYPSSYSVYAVSGNVSYYHNTLYNVGGDNNVGTFGFYSISSNGFNYTPSSITIKNNIIYSNETAAHYIRINSPAPPAILDSNLWYGLGDFASNTLGDVGVNLNSQDNIDPLFIDIDNRDFRLQQSSSAINNGTNVGILQDFNGILRPQSLGFDIGAYEFIFSESYNTYDTNKNNFIDTLEIISITSAWKKNELTMMEAFELLTKWKKREII